MSSNLRGLFSKAVQPTFAVVKMRKNTLQASLAEEPELDKIFEPFAKHTSVRVYLRRACKNTLFKNRRKHWWGTLLFVGKN